MRIHKEKERGVGGWGRGVMTDKRETALETNEQSNKFTFQH